MKHSKSMKISTKLILQTVLILALVLTSAFVYIVISSSNRDRTHAYNQLQVLSERNAAIVREQLDQSLNLVQNLALSMQRYDSLREDARRDYYNDVMEEILINNPQLIGVWACFEPQSIDGLDGIYANRRVDTDETGRYIPYFYQSGNQVGLEALVEYETQGDGDFYLLARDSGRETIMEPFYYEVDGQSVLMTTLAVPVRDHDDTVLGVVGVDLPLDRMQQIDFQLGEYDSTYMVVTTNQGNIVIHPDMDRINTNIADLLGQENRDSVLTAIHSGTLIAVDDYSDMDQELVRKVYTPVEIGRTGTPWSTSLIVNRSDVMTESNRTIVILIAILLLVILINAVALGFTIRGLISRPLQRTLFMIQEIGKGHFKHRLNINSSDEVGQMAKAMDQLADDLQIQVIGTLNQISRGDVSAEITAEDDEDEISPALQTTIEAIRRLVDDAGMLVDAAVSGRLDTRADASRHEGHYRTIVEGVNATLDAVIAPLQESSSVLEAMSKGDLQQRVQGDYQGDYAVIKKSLNHTLESLSVYIKEISSVLTEMANSNFDVRVDAAYEGDFSPIKTALNHIIDSFNEMLADMNNAAEQVAAGSRQVSDGSQALSQGATEQASSIEQLTASIHEIAEQTRQNALSANSANELSIKARDQAMSGNARMGQMQQAMTEINSSSASISKIIKVIDDIAFQTNILALNAAVEAARAGQHGRGFAVVAEEVRNLAARSAKAANETTELIEGSIVRTKAGTAIADETAVALGQIVDDISEAADLVNTIAAASNEQASAIAQVNQGVDQVSQVVQSNSATSEESAATSEELSSQAELLQERIAKFRLRKAKTHREQVLKVEDPRPVQRKDTKPGIDLSDSDYGKY